MVATDGCGAPLLSTSLTGLARAFRTLATAESGPEHRIADAIRAFPEWTSGTRRDEAALLKAIPGSIGKAGAESCYAVGARRRTGRRAEDRRRSAAGAAGADGRGAGADGRARTRQGVDGAAVRRTGVVELLGGGVPVGAIRPVF